MDKWLPLITGLIGAIIGSAASIITIYIQMKTQAKAERVKLGTAIAIEEYKFHLKRYETKNMPSVQPISSYAHLYIMFMNSLYKNNGNIDEKEYKKIIKKSQDFCRLNREMFPPNN